MGLNLRRFLFSGSALLIVMTLFAAQSVEAQALDGTLKRIKASGTINLGYMQFAPPFSLLGADKIPAGYSIDLCKHVASVIQKQLNVTLKLNWVEVTTDNGTILAGGGLDPFYVERQATKQEVQVYSILTSNDDSGAVDDGGTSDIAPLTGGQDYVSAPVSFALERTVVEIAHGLAVQYRIGYRSTNDAKDGKWRKIKVSLVDVPESLGKIKVWTKSGYYADKEKKK